MAQAAEEAAQADDLLGQMQDLQRRTLGGPRGRRDHEATPHGALCHPGS
jgi:hypothetical protein